MGSTQADDGDPLPIGSSGDEDFLTWLSSQWWVPWAMLVVFMVIGLWMIRSMVIHRGRSHRIRRAAAGARMQYREQDGFDLSRARFHHMAHGKDRGWTATNVVTLDSGSGLRTHAFDLRSWADVTVSEGRDGLTPDVVKTVRKYQGATYSGAMAPLSVNAPRLVLARENFASKLFSAATGLDLDVESEAFNRWYHVICADRTFAREVLDARMIDLMTQTEGKISFEFLGHWLLLHTVQLEPPLLPGLARLAERMSRVVPQLVIDRSGGQPGFTAIPR